METLLASKPLKENTLKSFISNKNISKDISQRQKRNEDVLIKSMEGNFHTLDETMSKEEIYSQLDNLFNN